MKQITLAGKRFEIKRISEYKSSDAKKFQRYINPLLKEGFLLLDKPMTLKEETGWLKKEKIQEKNKKRAVTVAQIGDQIAGIAEMWKKVGIMSHVAELGISVGEKYRGIGLGEFLLKETIISVKRELKPKVLRLSVLAINQRAINLYKKIGYKTVAVIPKQFRRKGKLIDELIMIRSA